MEKYILLYAGKTRKNAQDTFMPVFEYIRKHTSMDVTLIGTNGYFGLKGNAYKLWEWELPRKPDVVLIWLPWWEDNRAVGIHAKKADISVVMLNHGTIMIKDDRDHVHKPSIWPADIGCLWGPRDLEGWREVNTKDKLIITGNPLFDFQNFKPKTIPGLPKRFALCLSSGHGWQADHLLTSAEKLSEIYPVVMKPHYLCPHVDRLKKKFPTFLEHYYLMDLIYQSTYILSNVTSALLFAIYWQKPIFVHSRSEPFYHYEEFRNKYSSVFNFKTDPHWEEATLQQAIRPQKQDFELFAHKADGKNTQRLVETLIHYSEKTIPYTPEPVCKKYTLAK